MDKPACALLVDANAREAVIDRQRHQLKGIASGHKHIAGMAATVCAGFALCRLHRMRRVTVARGDQHGPAVVRSQGLQPRHETGVHVQLACVLAAELVRAEVGVVLPAHGFGSWLMAPAYRWQRPGSCGSRPGATSLARTTGLV